MSRFRWVACAADVNQVVSRERHLVIPGAVTTVCGCTASDPKVWRGNLTKPRCKTCARNEQEEELRKGNHD